MKGCSLGMLLRCMRATRAKARDICSTLPARCVDRSRFTRRRSDSSLQVKDPKASATPTSLPTTSATFLGSATIVVAHSNMENGALTKALDVSAQHLHSDAQPSSTLSERSRTDAQSSQSVAAPLFCCAHSSAASERAASYTHRVRPWVPRWPSGLSTATFETISVCPSDLLLALDAPSAGDTCSCTVVWGVIPYTVE